MKYVVLVLVLVLTSAVLGEAVPIQSSQSKKTASAAKPKPTATRKSTSAKTVATAKPRTTEVKPAPQPEPTPVPLTEKEQFDKASAHELAADRVAALEKFLADFPASEHRPAAIDLLVSSRILIAEEMLLSGDAAGAVVVFRRVIEDAPQPVPAELFSESIARIPMTLFRRGQRAAAGELAALIESKVESDANQLVELANFYLTTENGAEAMRVAAKAMAKDPASPAVHRTLALTHRINFDLELAADSYARALELDPKSVAAKRGLAEMKRALGRSEEAIVLYRELVAASESDVTSRTGLVLSLFDAGKRTEAEAEMARMLEANPGNIILLSGAAYWYASRGIGDKAVELAKKAIEREPRYIWSHIALARGLMAQGKPVAAEQALWKARSYGNFPTLEYEIASARIAAGFFQHAAEDLAKQFSVTPSGVKTRLGGRLAREEKSFAELLAPERRASIFAPAGADTAESGEILRALLDLGQKLQAPEPNEAEIAAAVDAFTKGSDKMKLHRQLYAASVLLERKIALGKVIELTKAATGNTDPALEVADPVAAVLANELYEPRTVAFKRNDFLLVPEVPRPTLSAILRGRIEEIAGWTLYQQNNYPDAVVRLRRAITVIPPDSAWWRSSLWRLGAALAADGKDAEALEAYINSYKTDKPDFGKYAIVEALYKKVHGSVDGLEEKIGADHVATLRTVPDLEPGPTPAAAETPTTGTTAETAAANDRPASAPETKPDTVPTEIAKPDKAPADQPVQMEKAADQQPADTPTVEKPVEPSPVKKDIDEVSKDTKQAEATEVKKDAGEVMQDPAAEKVVEAPQVKKDAGEVDQAPPAPEKTGEPPKEVKDAEPGKEPPVERKDPSDSKTDDAPTTNATEVKPAESKPADNKTADEPTDASIAINKTPLNDTAKPAAGENKNPKPLFEPIIITIPDSRPRRVKTTNESTASATDKPTTDAEKPVEEAPPPCSIVVSQETISLINNGGTLGILVNLEGPGDIKTLTARSSSVKDIEVLAEPEIGGIPDRRFYVIRSISQSVGVYTVTFAAPCGKKEVIVTVR